MPDDKPDDMPPMSRGRLPWDCECPWPLVGETLCAGCGSVPGLFNVNGITPARLAISASPSCQCMASAARQGTCISSATLCHISGLNLGPLLALSLYAGILGRADFWEECRRYSADSQFAWGLTFHRVGRVYSCALRPTHCVSRDSFGSGGGS